MKKTHATPCGTIERRVGTVHILGVSCRGCVIRCVTSQCLAEQIAFVNALQYLNSGNASCATSSPDRNLASSESTRLLCRCWPSRAILQNWNYSCHRIHRNHTECFLLARLDAGNFGWRINTG